LAQTIHRQNLRRYKYELWTAATEARRDMVLALIAAEDERAAREGWAPDPD
jgi:hypothetical protein